MEEHEEEDHVQPEPQCFSPRDDGFGERVSGLAQAVEQASHQTAGQDQNQDLRESTNLHRYSPCFVVAILIFFFLAGSSIAMGEVYRITSSTS